MGVRFYHRTFAHPVTGISLLRQCRTGCRVFFQRLRHCGGRFGRRRNGRPYRTFVKWAAERPAVFDYLPYVAVALIVTGLFGQALTRVRAQSLKSGGYDSIIERSEWALTGNIDFGCPEGCGDNEQNLFYLRVEEFRTLRSASGAKRTELRWRNPTLAETKQVTASYNEGAFGQSIQSSSAFQAPNLVPDPDLFDHHAPVTS
jgi:hypothetical protein